MSFVSILMLVWGILCSVAGLATDDFLIVIYGTIWVIGAVLLEAINKVRTK